MVRHPVGSLLQLTPNGYFTHFQVQYRIRFFKKNVPTMKDEVKSQVTIWLYTVTSMCIHDDLKSPTYKYSGREHLRIVQSTTQQPRTC